MDSKRELVRSTSKYEHESLVEQYCHHQREIQNRDSDRARKNKPHPCWPLIHSQLVDRQAYRMNTCNVIAFVYVRSTSFGSNLTNKNHEKS